MALKVFISYRRDDSSGHAGRVHDRLEREFGRDLLFMDVDDVPLGANFVKVLSDAVVKCDALLAIIGPGWLDARDEDGNRRLENPDDFVRIEIATALKRDVPVIPILLEGTRVPKADQLPDDLKELSVRNALNIRHVSFVDDMERLIRGLKRAQSPQQPESVAPSLVDQSPQLAEADAQRKAAAEAKARRTAEEERKRRAEAEERTRAENEERKRRAEEAQRKAAEEAEAKRKVEKQKEKREHAGPSHLHVLAKNWWLVRLRGIVSILFGVVVLLWPGLTWVTLVLFYAAFALVDGVIALASAFGKDRPAPLWWLILVGIAGIAAGIITFLWPGDVTLVLVFSGAWALVHAIFEIVGAIKLRKEIDNEWWLILAGIISVLFGLLVLFVRITTLGLIWAIAAYLIVFGILLIGLSFRLRKHLPAP